MIITTTSTVESKRIVAYKGIVFGEVITGIDVFKDFGAELRNIFGGRSRGYEDELLEARTRRIGANAVVGIKMDYETLGSNNDADGNV